MLSEQTVSTVLELITSLAKDTLPGSVGAGVTLVDEDGSHRTAAATDPIVERLDALQYELGEGPCLTATHEAVPVRVDDLSGERRWPRWSAAAAQDGTSSVLSVPIVHAGRSFGAVKVYSPRTHGYTDQSEEILERFAAQASILLANMHTLAAAEELNEKLLQALRDRDLIATGKGIVMLRENLDADAAMRRLLEMSAQRRITVREVAAEVVASIHIESV
ncbi:GAF and ANTAR domain-containing protein [Rhodococcus sp. Z13]|uniref:GAF and ANTAR domain-containing protein n=1 Tax=Rhodococcus sacchari TaxID=2962047 RepID=A0ACD4DLL3_9NOCA|nr:GAF and ANTAR domain-containing protein [Rhodococcus sp. Z13]UYP20922.1 GAF and ANTAR domain-containing protein [Rhodococcus sp. Z13]